MKKQFVECLKNGKCGNLNFFAGFIYLYSRTEGGYNRISYLDGRDIILTDEAFTANFILTDKIL